MFPGQVSGIQGAHESSSVEVKFLDSDASRSSEMGVRRTPSQQQVDNAVHHSQAGSRRGFHHAKTVGAGEEEGPSAGDHGKGGDGARKGLGPRT